MDFSRELIEEAERAVKNFYSALKSVLYLRITAAPDDTYTTQREEFIQAMDDDFNSAKAIAVLFDLVHHCRNESLPRSDREQAALLLVELGKVLGFFQSLEESLYEDVPDTIQKLMELIIAYRQEARARKDWQLSDRIRDDLKALGIELKDTPAGCSWSLSDKTP